MDPNRDQDEKQRNLVILKMLVENGMSTNESAMAIRYERPLASRLCRLNAIHVAVDHGQWHVLPLLLQGGCPVEVNSLTGDNPLHQAFLADRLDMAMLLSRERFK